MKIIKTISEMQMTADDFHRQGKIIGLVPTMGYLHEGHLQLVRILRPQCDVLVISIFVNPIQFAPTEDLDKYPRDFERDEQLCRSEKVDIIFYPDNLEMYPQPFHTFINVEKLSEGLCGASRPGHFRGVATVVAKLFNIVKPQLAIFGEKDYQQLMVIKQMVKDLNFDITIHSAPIVREADGLAMSSRNKYLSPEERKAAPLIYQSLLTARTLYQQGMDDPEEITEKMISILQKIPRLKVDYISFVDSQTLWPVTKIKGEVLVALAVYIGQTRLIDNIVIRG